MKKFLIQITLLVAVIGFGIFFFAPGRESQNINIPFIPQPKVASTILINDVTIKVEIADTQSERSKGLSNKESLGEDEGMLFVFDKNDKYPFWMKGLKFPLDFVWIRDDKVVDILENVPAPTPNQPDSDLPIYAPKEEVNKVLELNGGVIKKFNIKIGDTIKLNK